MRGVAVLDAGLVDAYEQTKGTPGHVEADAFAAEIERRGLDG